MTRLKNKSVMEGTGGRGEIVGDGEGRRLQENEREKCVCVFVCVYIFEFVSSVPLRVRACVRVREGGCGRRCRN